MPIEIAIIKQSKIYRISVPPGTRIFHGDRAKHVDFDIACSDGVHYLAQHVLGMAARGEKGFRLTGFERVSAD